MKIYDFTVKDINGEDVSLLKFKGKAMLIVNTASKCGFTPQFQALEELYKKYEDKLVVLGFPCNQFKGQDPKSNEEIASFCQLNYGVTFPMFAKVEVNGKNEEPLFTYLKKEKSGFMGSNIKWNFTKFLVDRKGVVVGRYSPSTKPESMEKDILKILD